MNWATARETCWTTASSSSSIYARDSRYLSKLQQQQQLLLPTAHDSSQSKDLLPSHMYGCRHLSQAFKDLVTTSITCLFHNMSSSSHNLRICLLPPQLWVKLNSPPPPPPPPPVAIIHPKNLQLLQPMLIKTSPHQSCNHFCCTLITRL